MAHLRIAVAQLGARMHYALPRCMEEAGCLGIFYTDTYAGPIAQKFSRAIGTEHLPEAMRRFLGRVPHGVPGNKIHAFTKFGMEYRLRAKWGRTPSQRTATHIWAGQRFCRLVNQTGLPESSAVYALNSAALELFAVANQTKRFAILEQTSAPRRIERELVQREHRAWPGWESSSDDDHSEEFAAREEEEWRRADLVVCGSEFVKSSYKGLGGDPEKCKVVPYGVDRYADKVERPKSCKLRVLFVGTVNLHKGVQYLLAAASKLPPTEFEFRIVGPIRLSQTAVSGAPKHVQFVGSVPRTEVAQHYRWADVFVFPSVCEGSATVCYEALAYGLPVITTPNAGSVVRDGLEGYVVPVSEYQPIEAKLNELQRSPEKREQFSAEARNRASEFTVASFRRRLISTLGIETPELCTTVN